jgi:hypothetical protein
LILGAREISDRDINEVILLLHSSVGRARSTEIGNRRENRPRRS